jgi:hypothetical protein
MVVVFRLKGIYTKEFQDWNLSVLCCCSHF